MVTCHVLPVTCHCDNKFANANAQKLEMQTAVCYRIWHGLQSINLCRWIISIFSWLTGEVLCTANWLIFSIVSR